MTKNKLVLISIDQILDSYSDYITDIDSQTYISLESILDVLIEQTNVKSLDEIESSLEELSIIILHLYDPSMLGEEILKELVIEFLEVILIKLKRVLLIDRSCKWHLKSIHEDTVVLICSGVN